MIKFGKKINLERDEDKRVQIVEDIVRRYLDIKPLIHRSIREAFAEDSPIP